MYIILVFIFLELFTYYITVKSVQNALMRIIILTIRYALANQILIIFIKIVLQNVFRVISFIY